ncbi:MAG TPA: DUF6580 family putative transport protein [Chthoniobacterales bacterium]|nr:DUF6580 family putative transport protein [Chthoniobacterales bacterium]
MIPAFLLVLVAVVYRIAAGILVQSGSATWLSNFAPFAAIALCGAAFFPTRYKFAVPLLALFVSDLVLNAYYAAPLLHPLIVGRYFALLVVGCLGWLLQHRASLKTLLPASVAGSVLFYVISNGFSWLSDPGYVKSAAGFVQALTVGLPAYSATPSWMFFRNSLVSDLIFTGLFVLAFNFGRATERSRAATALPRAA